MLNVGQTQKIRELVLEHNYSELDEYLRGVYSAQTAKGGQAEVLVMPKIAEKAQLAIDWLNSEEGQQKLRNSLDAAELFCKELREKSKVTPEDMRQIIDI